MRMILFDATVTKPFDAAKFTECIRSIAKSPMNQVGMEKAS
jgi:hypothetical protein